MDPITVAADPLPWLILLVLSLTWAARGRPRPDLATLISLPPDDRPD
jgi:hypothetical protein